MPHLLQERISQRPALAGIDGGSERHQASPGVGQKSEGIDEG